MKLALLRLVGAPLPDMPPRNLWLWRGWLWIVKRRYEAAADAWGEERAARYDYIPF